MENYILPKKQAIIVFFVFAFGYFLSCLLRAITATLSPVLTSEFNLLAADYGPNEILQIGFDTSPQIMTAFEKGYVHLTSDQQPFLQGYLPVLSLCQTAVLGTGAINQDTGAGFVDTNNYKSVKALADAGLR